MEKVEVKEYFNERLSSGTELLDGILNGGYEKGTITSFYGNAGSGKTTFCLLAVKEALKEGKVIYIDTEGGFSVERFLQLYEDKSEGFKLLDNVYVLKPSSFEEQKSAFEYLKDNIKDNVVLVVVDSISMLYRIELGKSNNIPEVTRALASQMSLLIQIANKNNIPVIVTSQVYSNLEKEENIMYGGDFMKYASKCLLELKYDSSNGTRKIILKKHRSIKEGVIKEYFISDKAILEQK